jgi:hypothetical protein
MWNKSLRGLLTGLFSIGALTGASMAHAATIEIVNLNEPGVGFNDPTPAAPVGGNPGTTLGEQRLNVFKLAAQIWGEKLQSNVKIQILSAVEPLPCTATGAVLGSAGPIQVFADFPGAPRPGTWYPVALANKLAKQDLAPGDPTVDLPAADIIARFNSEIGKPGCLEGSGFYLGFDGNEPPGQSDFATVVLHEFGHGLGFLQTTTDETTGERFDGLPDVWEEYLFDNRLRKTWLNMTNEERKVSALNGRALVWNGPRVQRNAPRVLERGAPDLFVAGGGFNRFVEIGYAEFGPPFPNVLATAVVPVTDTGGLTTACVALNADSAAKVAGKTALIDRGGCAFSVKVKNAQLAGAKAVIIADNAAGTPPLELGGEDATITIPAVRVTRDDGAALRAAATAATNPAGGPISVLFKNQLRLTGADYAGRPAMYAPNPFQPGSSISHYDTSARPNLLMEPAQNDNLTLNVDPPKDLTLPLLRDIGW